MYHFSRYVTDPSGNVQTSGTITVTLTGGGTPTIYSDNTGSVKGNPFSIPISGLVDFYIANSHFDVQAVTPAGTVTLPGQVALDTDALAGNITIVDNLTVNGSFTAASFNPSVVNSGVRQDIASAATVNLDSATSNYVRITGNTNITAITLTDGRDRDVVFSGALTLTNGASLILPGAANIITAAGDTMTVRGEASGVVRIIDYTRAATTPVVTVTGASSRIKRATSIGTSASSLYTYLTVNTNGTAGSNSWRKYDITSNVTAICGSVPTTITAVGILSFATLVGSGSESINYFSGTDTIVKGNARRVITDTGVNGATAARTGATAELTCPVEYSGGNVYLYIQADVSSADNMQAYITAVEY